MRISELAQESGTPVATIKYYIREGLLPAGTPVNARRHRDSKSSSPTYGLKCRRRHLLYLAVPGGEHRVDK